MTTAREEIPMRITINLTKTEYEHLQQVARTDRRPMRDQAAVIIARALAEQEQPREEAQT